MSHDDYLRGLRSKKSKKVMHPYAAIEHRVINSAAFAALKPSSVALLLILARQLTKDNNGHLQATWSYCRKRGIGSENTLRASIYDLIEHGFLCRTRSRGANKVAALYAVTWLAIKRRDGLYLHTFNKDGWKAWEEKNHPSKIEVTRHHLSVKTFCNPAKTDVVIPQENDDYELVPCTSVLSVSEELRDPRQWL